MPNLLAPAIPFRYTDNNGLPLVGGKVYTYVSGTTTLQDTYSDAAGTAFNTNPVILNSRGEADIYLIPGKTYRFRITDSNDVVIDTVDGIIGASPAGGSEWIDVLNYGADPTGVADSSAAFQQAINDATTSPRKTLYVRAGTYKINTGLTVNGRLAMIGDGMNNTVINYTPTSGSCFSWTADGSYSYFKGIKLIGPGRVLGDTASGFTTFQGAACVFYVWEQCLIENFPMWGIDINDSFNCAFRDSRIRQNGVRGTLAEGGTDGQGGGIRLVRITFTGAATTGNDYTNNYFTGNNVGIKIEPSGNNNKAFNTRLDNCIFEENYVGIDLRNLGTGGKGRYQFLNTCYFEANLYAGALLDEATTIACYQNNTTPGTGVAPSWSKDGPDGILFEGRYVEDRPSRFKIGNNSAAPYDDSQNEAFVVDKNETGNFVTTLRVRNTSGIVFTAGAGTTTTNEISIATGSGSPEGAIDKNSGSLFLNRSGTLLNNILYVKTTDNTSTGWISIGNQYGSTAERPVSTSTNKGVIFYDTDILRNVTSNGAGLWREYNGLTSVTGTSTNFPSHIEGASYYATDLDTIFTSDGARWRQQSLRVRFGSVSNGGTTTIQNRGEHYVGTTTGTSVATHTLILPSGANAISGDRVRFTVSNGVTNLTVSAGTATIVNSPTTILAGQTVEFAYNDSVQTWYRVTDPSTGGGGGGTSGISGWSGFSGYSGDNPGSSGFSGISGFSGFSGSGISGFSGFSGFSGAGTSGWSGWSGISGFSGNSTSGFSGWSGISGFSGSGISGWSGFSGAGTSGWSGWSGISGWSGVSTSGWSGWSGISGFSGSGISGWSGFSGSGISGWSGFSGTSGFSGIVASLSIIASEALSAGDLVNIYNNAGTANVRKANATTAGKEAHGFVIAAVNTNSTATVYSYGVTSASYTGLTPGTVYLSTSAGLPTGTAPSTTNNIVQRVGVAVSSSQILFIPGEPITLV